VVTTKKRRQVVTHLVAAFDVSARRACELIRLSRSRWHYKLKRPEQDLVLRERLKALATERPRFGYKRLHLLLRREGVVVNHKRVLRLYREERLAVRPHRGRKHAAVARVPLSPPTRRNERWGMDFIHDSCEDGRQFRSLTMVDELTRECPAIEVDTSLPAARVIGVLDGLALERGLPETIIVDNGPEFISRALDVWAYRRGIELHFIRPGKPVENAYIESFHSRFRDECLNANWFRDISDARFQIERWRRDYNEARPHTSLGGLTPAEYTDRIKQEEQQEALTERLSA
jgi:putative transposase